MAEWRFLRGWTDGELHERLVRAGRLTRNFVQDGATDTASEGWGRHASRAVIGREPPGPATAEGPLHRAWELVQDYAFSDPRIVRGHFDRQAHLRGRRMLLEVRVLGLHYLGAVFVSDVREDVSADRTVRAFRYDTLEGHFERGFEWFAVAKDHASGDVTFSISAAWRQGELPNAWSRLGFRLLARRYQRAWHRLAHLRLRELLGSRGLPPLPRGRRLVHSGPELKLPAVQVVASGSAGTTADMEAEPERPA